MGFMLISLVFMCTCVCVLSHQYVDLCSHHHSQDIELLHHHHGIHSCCSFDSKVSWRGSFFFLLNFHLSVTCAKKKNYITWISEQHAEFSQMEDTVTSTQNKKQNTASPYCALSGVTRFSMSLWSTGLCWGLSSENTSLFPGSQKENTLA